MRWTQEPEFQAKFKIAFGVVAREHFCDLQDFAYYAGDADEFKMDYSNAIGETLSVMGLNEPETDDGLLDLYDLAEEAGFPWPEEFDE